MKGSVKFYTISVFVSLLTTSASINTSETETFCKSEECLASATILKNSIETQINPCDDFYRFACGNWPRNHQYMKSTVFGQSSIELRYFQNEEKILEFLNQNNSQDEPESVHKARQLYSTCLNRESYGRIQPLKDLLSTIGVPIVASSTNKNPDFEYDRALPRAARLAGVMMFFSALVGNNPYNQSLNSIILTKPGFDLDSTLIPWTKNGKKLKRDVFDVSSDEMVFMEKITQKLSENGSEKDINLKFNVSSTREDSEFKTAILRQAMTQMENLILIRPKFNSSFIPIMKTLEELQNITDTIADNVKTTLPKLNWTKYFEETFAGLDSVTLDLANGSNVQIVIQEMSYFQDIITFMYNRNIKEIEFGLWWKIVSTLVPYADFDIFEAKRDTSESSNENSCKNVITNTLDMVVSYMYLKDEKYEIIKKEIEDMLQYIEKSYEEMIIQATWMDQETEEKALLKLASMKSFVAYPNSTEMLRILAETYDEINITQSFFDTVIEMVQYAMNKNLGMLDQINNSTIENWTMPPITVNAAYDHLKNAIFIPAAILEPPLYINSLKALVYGTIGSVVAHEISHGFDHTGRQYNNEGLLEDWWNNDTAIKYEEKSICFLKAYDTYFSTFDEEFQKTNSTLTVDEDISDNAGFKASLFAYRNYVSENGEEPLLQNFEKFTPEQLFTLGFANFYCEKPSQITAQMNKFIDHSPHGVRVNGVFKHSQEFASIWNCSSGTNMNPKQEKCSLW